MIIGPAVSTKFTVWIAALIALTQPAPASGFLDPNKWVIGEPNVTYDEWTDIFTIHYGLHPSINFTDNFRSEVLVGNCTYPKLGVADGVVSDYINASGYHIFEVDPYTMSKDPRLFNYSLWENSTIGNPQPKAEIDLCVKGSLWSGPESDPNAAQAASFETMVTLNIDLVDNPTLEEFNTNAKLKPGENEIIEQDGFEVWSYFCDPTTQEWADILPIKQGQVITICVESTPEALARGVYVEGIKEFAWVREYNDSNFTQYVIQNYTLVDPYISIYDCIPPLVICDFSMMMLANFFLLPGEASGIGMARLGFGPVIPLPANYSGVSTPPGPPGNSTSGRVRFLRDGPPRGLSQEGKLVVPRPKPQMFHLPQQVQQEQRRGEEVEETEREDAGGSSFGLVAKVDPDKNSRAPLKTAGGEGLSVRPGKWFSVFASHLIILGSVFWLGLDWEQ